MCKASPSSSTVAPFQFSPAAGSGAHQNPPKGPIQFVNADENSASLQAGDKALFGLVNELS